MALWTRIALAVLVFVTTLELGARLVIALDVGRSVTDTIAPNVLTVTGTPIIEQVNALTETHTIGERLHPFVGYLPAIAHVRPEGPVTLAAQREAHAPTSPLFSKDPADLVVGVAGGSVAYQFALNGGGARLAELLAAQPQFQGRRPQIVALAAVGMKQPQQTLWYAYLLALGARFDLLVSLDGFNEVAMHESENEPYGISPVYPRYWLQRIGPAVAAPLLGERMYLVARRADLVREFLASPLSRSGAAQLVWLLRDQASRKAVEGVEARLRGLHRFEDLEFATQGPVLAGSSESERLDFQVAIWRGALLQMHRNATANGARSFHFLQPNQYDPGSKTLSPHELANAFKEDHRYGKHVPEGYTRLRAAGVDLVSEGLRFHDLSRVFEGVAEDLYVDDCCHLNRAANLRLAAAIATAIESWGGR